VLAGKLSLFVLCPLIAAVAVGGDALVALLSSGRFNAAGMTLLGFVIALVPYSQRQLLESVAVAADLSHFCLVASAVSALAVPAIFLASPAGFGVASAVLAMLIGHAIFVMALTGYLHARVGFRGDAMGWLKMTAAAMAAYLIGSGFAASLAHVHLVWWPWAGGAVAVLSFLAVSWRLKPFSAEERGRINRLARRQVFVW
jgi:hypothetical protein